MVNQVKNVSEKLDSLTGSRQDEGEMLNSEMLNVEWSFILLRYLKVLRIHLWSRKRFPFQLF